MRSVELRDVPAEAIVGRSSRDLFEVSVVSHYDPLRFRLRRLDGTEVRTNIQAVPRKDGGKIYAVTATITAANDNSLN